MPSTKAYFLQLSKRTAIQICCRSRRERSKVKKPQKPKKFSIPLGTMWILQSRFARRWKIVSEKENSRDFLGLHQIRVSVYNLRKIKNWRTLPDKLTVHNSQQAQAIHLSVRPSNRAPWRTPWGTLHSVFRKRSPVMCFTLHGTRTEPGIRPGLLGSNISYRNVHTGPSQGQLPGPIVSYCTSFVPSIDPSPVQCD